jgi:photosystem II stability/assembly factor-like uncharacterized protein
MPLKKMLIVASLLFTAHLTYAQQYVINILDSGRKTSIRGLSVVDDDIVWASGSNGTVARSVDGGKTFEWLTVAGYEKRDFRDIEAFDKNTAIIMGIAEPAIILKTKDGGKSWYKVFEDSTKGMFLDAMDFDENNYHGFVVGDPIDENLYITYTEDGGETWIRNSNTNKIDRKNLKTKSTEAFFASSGTNVKIVSDRDQDFLIFATGGTKSRFFSDDGSASEIPLIQGKETTGANSIAGFDRNNLIIVGGDFTKDKDTTGNCALSNDFGQTWHKPTTPPHGYRSCVEYITKDKLITCGTSGVDISNDGGMNWELISTKSFHVCQKAKNGNKVFLAGGNGKIAMLDMQ